MSHAPLNSPASPAWWPGRARGLSALGLAAIGAFLLLGAVVQIHFGVLIHREWRLPAAHWIRTDGKAFKAHLPAWATGSLAESRAVLLQDGRPIGSRASHTSTVVQRGNGWFKITREQLYFSLPENNDPRPDIKRYSLSAPDTVKPTVWIAGAVCLVAGLLLIRKDPCAANLCRGAARHVESLPVPVLLLGVFATGLAIRAWEMAENPEFSDGCFTVKGVPYSDAGGWDELAVNLAAGRGFSGGFDWQRPLYPVMLAPLYTLAGPSVAAAKALNVFWGALAATAVCGIGILGGSRIAGLAGAATLLMGDDYITYQHLIMTETPGVVFATSSVLLLGLAVAKPTWWRIVGAGLSLACANLVSGFGLFALPGYGLVALATWWRRQGAGRAWLQSAALAGVVAVAWLPWLIRQHAVHGFWNLSSSSADLLYAAANPAYGKLNTEAGQEWRTANVPETTGARYQFYMRRYAEVVKAHPLAYVQTIGRGALSFLDFWLFHGPDRIGVVCLGLIAASIAALRRQPVWAVLISGVLVLAGLNALEGKSSTLVWTLGTTLALITCPPRSRPLWVLIAITVPSVAFLAGMTGGHLARRMWTACDWAMPLLLVQGGSGAIRLLAGGLEVAWSRCRKSPAPAGAESPAPTSSPPPWLPSGLPFAGSAISWALLGPALIGTVLSVSLYLMMGHKPAPRVELASGERAGALEEARRHFDFLASITPDDPRWWTRPGQIGDYKCLLRPWEDVNHWARSFEVRPYLRTVAYAKLLENATGDSIACQLRARPGDIPRDQPLLLLGIRNYDPNAHLGHDQEEIEVLGFAPLDVSTSPARVRWDQASWLPFSPEADAIAQAKP